ncbi:MAG: proprotein convertase P-domain-containing protein [Thermoanaerobaculia bacterium]
MAIPRVLTSLLVLGMALGSPADALVKAYNVAPDLTIPDDATRVSVLNVPDFGTINDLNVINVTLKLPEIGEAVISLTSPGGITVQIKGTRGSIGDGIIDCDFNDEVTNPFPSSLGNGRCPTSTVFSPEGDLSDFDGLQINGDWTLTVTDVSPMDAFDCDCDGSVVGPSCSRKLENWGMLISFTPDPDCALVTVSDPVIDTTRTHQACSETTVGPNVTLVSPADLRVYGGERVSFLNGFAAQPSTELTVGTCGHDLCTTGAFLDASCMPCVGDICLVDPVCCGAAIGQPPVWDSICVGKVRSVCGLICPP